MDILPMKTHGLLETLLWQKPEKRGLDTAVEIRLNNGYTVFKYAGNSTNLNNEAWMDKMYATVRRVEKSTMLLYSELKKSEETLEDIGLDPREYSYMGGGFPIRVEEVGGDRRDPGFQSESFCKS